ncbi:MAG: SDR family oxidoreductase [Chloroflexota bacterium]
MSDLKSHYANKLALITGGSSGIGLALAKELAGHGARVWLLARRKDALSEAQKKISSACRTISMDVSDWNQVKRAVGQVIRESGVPDIIINSAGVTQPGYVQELDVDIFRQMMEINYMGTVHVVKALLPGIIERGSGHIINISSAAGFLGVFGYSAYGASKYAVRGFSDVLRVELKPHGIRVSVAFPPDTDTPQLAYEAPFKPPETKALSGTTKILSPEVVAREILSAAARGKYIILPGFDTKLLYHLNNMLGNGVYAIMDWLITRARQKI